MPNSGDTQKVDCRHIEIGMKVVELDCPWIESPFTVKGFKITSENEIKQLRQHCNYVFIAVPKQVKTEKHHFGEHGRIYKNTQSFEQALPKAKSTHRMAQTVVKGFLKNLRLGQELNTTVAKKVVKQCVDNVIANANAMIWLGLLKDVDEYTAQHSLNVGLLSIVLGRAEGLSPTDLETVGLCGMMHDMGKAEIPLEILNKEGAFSTDEFELMKLHTTKGYHILNNKPDMEDIVAEVAYSHHERLNGQGYPRRLPREQISYFTRIVAIADTYDAITSARVYSPAKTSLEALTILMGASGSHFDSDLVKRFVACIGVYPAGAIVELSTKEVGIVLPTDNEHQNTPKILIVRDKNKAKCRQSLLDLAQKPEDENDKPIRIKHSLSEGIFDIELANYHGKITGLADQ